MKRTPLKRKVGIREAYIRKLKARGTEFSWDRNGKVKRKRPLKKVSRSQRTRLQSYYSLQQSFLARTSSRYCLICTVRREHGENLLVNLATEVHHWAGRTGRLLCYVPYFRPSCFHCREWPHAHPDLARQYGLLAPAAIYNVFP